MVWVGGTLKHFKRVYIKIVKQQLGMRVSWRGGSLWFLLFNKIIFFSLNYPTLKISAVVSLSWSLERSYPRRASSRKSASSVCFFSELPKNPISQTVGREVAVESGCFKSGFQNVVGGSSGHLLCALSVARGE